MMLRPYNFVPNSADDLHCYQSVLRMAWQGLFGETLTEREADDLTGFEPGTQTWPFRGMLALAERGSHVSNIEDFDPRAFIADPKSELLRQAHGDEDLVTSILAVADVGRELPIVQRLLEHPRVSFITRAPTTDELRQLVSEADTIAICNVNYCALAGKDGYTGHFVIVDRFADETVRLQDPGLPPLRNHEVILETFEQAWLTPGANVITVRGA